MKELILTLVIAATLAACGTEKIELLPNQEMILQSYTNEELNYTFQYPSKYTIDTSGLTNSVSKRVEVFPLEGGKEPYSPDYFDVHLEDRELDFLLTGVFNQMEKTETEFGGQEAYQFIPTGEENTVWVVVPYEDSIYIVTSGRTNLPEVQGILNSFRFL